MPRHHWLELQAIKLLRNLIHSFNKYLLCELGTVLGTFAISVNRVRTKQNYTLAKFMF